MTPLSSPEKKKLDPAASYGWPSDRTLEKHIDSALQAIREAGEEECLIESPKKEEKASQQEESAKPPRARRNLFNDETPKGN